MRISKLPVLKTFLGIVCACAGAVIIAVASFFWFDHKYPALVPDMTNISTEVVDRDGKLLRAFSTKQGRWRLKASLDELDSEFVKLLIAYEDQRFWQHMGVDALAMVRAVGQLIGNGRIISGASTITMQLARLSNPRKERSLGSKFYQIVRALQLEMRMSKRQILEAYLTLAPYGGNLEGIRAASLAYFGKEPKGLTLSQSALLVALPQSPERRRPDRFAANAKAARDKVLARMFEAKIVAPGELERAGASKVKSIRLPLPHFAPHLAQRAISKSPDKIIHKVTIKKHLQKIMEGVARDHARRIDRKISVAIILADAQNGEILAEVGSPDYLDADRSGWVDMTNAMRSPGSTLKPFIYGLAFEEGLIKPETLIFDAPANFAGYRPQNFDMKYQGEISIRKALQHSLNVPAVHLLEAVGPARLLAMFKRSSVKIIVPGSNQPGLAIALGGMGISLRSLTQLYTAFANRGWSKKLHNGLSTENPNAKSTRNILLQNSAAWHVSDILAGSSAPENSQAIGIAYKTGTSYGYRDAWAIGFDGRHVLGVWVGRADNGSIPGITGRLVAAPILFDAFTKSGLEIVALKPAPAGTMRTAHSDLPVTLKRFGQHIGQGFGTDADFLQVARIPESHPQIVFPPEGARVELAKNGRETYMPLVMKLQNGRPPFRWLANGKLFSPRVRKRVATWVPHGSGYSTLTVIDAVGRASSVNIYIAKAQTTITTNSSR